MRRFILMAACAASLGAAGCVEGEQTYTLNPDGSGKVRMDVTMTPPFNPLGAPPRRPGEEQSLDEMLLGYTRSLLQIPGVTAWKDVSAAFAPDGRIKFAGTAYFKKIDDLDLSGIQPLLGPQFALSPGPDGSLQLARKKKKPGADPEPTGFLLKSAGKKTPEELAKMPDADVDAYIMKERIEFQSVKPILIAMLSDAKLKVAYIMPGDVGKISGFKVDGRKLSLEIDGEKVIGGFKKVYGLDAAELRKVYRSQEAMDALTASVFGFAPDDSAKAVVAKPTGPQFDYDKEVKTALAAYPELRKKLKLGADVRLPDGTPTPKSPFGAPPPK